MPPSRRRSLDALTGIRFFAAMHVVTHHYLIMVPGFRANAPAWLSRLVAAAPCEVTLFFVLSGFILAYNYLRPDGSLGVTKREFWSARIARVYPIYLFGLLVYAPIAVARYFSGTGLSIVDIGPGPAFAVSGILTLLLLQSWTVLFTAWNGPCWSISSEAFFYALFPWAAPRIMRWTRPRLVWNVSALWVASMIGPIYFLIAVLGHSTRQTKEIWEVALEIHPLLRVIHFTIGIAAAVLFLRSRGEGSARAPMLANAVLVVAMIAAALVPSEARSLLDNGLAPLLAVLIYVLAFERGALHRILSHPITVLLGEASFSLYILHNPLWNYLARMQNMVSFVLHGHFPLGLAKPRIATEWNYDMSGWMFGFYVILLIAISHLAARYVEQPARLYVRRLLSERRPRLVQTQVSGALP